MSSVMLRAKGCCIPTSNCFTNTPFPQDAWTTYQIYLVIGIAVVAAIVAAGCMTSCYRKRILIFAYRRAQVCSFSTVA